METCASVIPTMVGWEMIWHDMTHSDLLFLKVIWGCMDCLKRDRKPEVIPLWSLWSSLLRCWFGHGRIVVSWDDLEASFGYLDNHNFTRWSGEKKCLESTPFQNWESKSNRAQTNLAGCIPTVIGVVAAWLCWAAWCYAGTAGAAAAASQCRGTSGECQLPRVSVDARCHYQFLFENCEYV